MKPCTVSPIEIEELKSDIRDVDAQLVSAKETLARVQADLAAWEERLAQRRSEIPQLEAELARLKQASGVTVTVEEDESAEESAAGI
jgi:chromosome segregation ATPase